jgi:hypothetical protein
MRRGQARREPLSSSVPTFVTALVINGICKVHYVLKLSIPFVFVTAIIPPRICRILLTVLFGILTRSVGFRCHFRFIHAVKLRFGLFIYSYLFINWFCILSVL